MIASIFFILPVSPGKGLPCGKQEACQQMEGRIPPHRGSDARDFGRMADAGAGGAHAAAYGLGI
jgi:hypothetical protein